MGLLQACAVGPGGGGDFLTQHFPYQNICSNFLELHVQFFLYMMLLIKPGSGKLPRTQVGTLTPFTVANGYCLLVAADTDGR